MDGGMGLTPFFSDDGKAPWEEGAMGGILEGLEKGKHVTPPPVRSAPSPGQSNSRGLALLNRLRQGAPANEDGEDGGIPFDQLQQKTSSSPTSIKDEKKTAKKDTKKKNNKKTTYVVDDTISGEMEDSADWFMTDKQITVKSQKEKLSILPPSTFHSSSASTSVVQAPTQQAVNSQNEHLVWMKQWVQQLPKAGSTSQFGDFRLDVNAVMNAMTTAQS